MADSSTKDPSSKKIVVKYPEKGAISFNKTTINLFACNAQILMKQPSEGFIEVNILYGQVIVLAQKLLKAANKKDHFI